MFTLINYVYEYGLPMTYFKIYTKYRCNTYIPSLFNIIDISIEV
jgi:hypothetical protein